VKKARTGVALGTTEALFVTRLYRAERIGGADANDGASAAAAAEALRGDVERACRSIAAEDRAGQAWSVEHGYAGYTSYASLADLTRRDPAFADLEGALAPHVAAFARAVELDLGRRKLRLDSLWVNLLEPGGHHAAHIHPHAVVSGTYYVVVPAGASALRLEDPRLPMLMAAPPRSADATREQRTFVDVAPAAGTLLLWESWLRHEVPVNRAAAARMSVSFNYALR
jgi:uncharacterized protein (TIGR02466 family)